MRKGAFGERRCLKNFQKPKSFLQVSLPGSCYGRLLSPIIEQLAKLCGVAWLLWQRMVTASLPGSAGGEPAAWSRVGGSPCCSVCELDAGSWWGTGRGIDRGWRSPGSKALAVVVGSQYEGYVDWLGCPLVFQLFVPGVP